MSSLVINDLSESTNLDRTAMADIRGGIDVQIGSVSSNIQTTDDRSGLSPDLLGKLVNMVIDGIRQQNRPH